MKKILLFTALLLIVACSEVDFGALPQSPGGVIGQAVQFIDTAQATIMEPNPEAGTTIHFTFDSASSNVQAFYEQTYIANSIDPSHNQWLPITITSIHTPQSELIAQITEYTFIYPSQGPQPIEGEVRLPEGLAADTYQLYFAEWEWVGLAAQAGEANPSGWDLNWIVQDVFVEASRQCDTLGATKCEFGSLAECNGFEGQVSIACFEGCFDPGDGTAACKECTPPMSMCTPEGTSVLECSPDGMFIETSCDLFCDSSSGDATCAGAIPDSFGFPDSGGPSTV